jgi:hypothetical protein
MRWGTQLERGYSTLIVAEIEGIPVRWVERAVATAADDTAPASTSGTTTDPSLVIPMGMTQAVDIDRQTGIANGRAMDVILDLDQMGDTARALFVRPSLKTILTADVTNPAATTIAVASTTGFAASGGFWLGREHITYTSVTATTFVGCTRGVSGYPWVHISNGASGYSFATDTPMYWRGRNVTLREYLVAPDGRMVGTGWTDADYSGVIWRGYIDTEPQVQARLMTFRALPIERRLAAKLGTSAEAKLEPPRPALPANIYVTASDKLVIIRESDGVSTQVPQNGPTGATTLFRWADQAIIEAEAFFTITGLSFDISRPHWLGRLFTIRVPSGYRVQSAAWFLGESWSGWLGVPTTSAPDGWFMRFIVESVANPWLFINAGLDVVGRPEAWPASGYGIIEVDGQKEVVAWDAVDATYYIDGFYAIRISRRGLVGTTRVDPWAEGATITALSGHIGTIEEALRTLLTSSGTGVRGTYDTLPTGYGLGMPDEWLDFDDYPANSVIAEALGDGGASVVDLLGGWLALWQQCIAQVEDGDDLVLRAIKTTVMDGANIPELTASDIILGTVQSMGLIEGPNSITIDAGVLGQGTEIKVRDVPRVQSEDWRTWELTAPSLSTTSSVGLAIELLSLSDGQQAVKVGVRPSFSAELGDLLRVTATHPEVYDWGTGDTATSILARVVGIERDIYTGERALTLLMPGQLANVRPLCPSAQVTAWTSTTIAVIDTVALTGFGVGSQILLYVAGDESATATARSITAITTTGATTEITISSAIVIATLPVGSWITYDVAGSDTEQDRHLYVGTGEFN